MVNVNRMLASDNSSAFCHHVLQGLDDVAGSFYCWFIALLEILLSNPNRSLPVTSPRKDTETVPHRIIGVDVTGSTAP